MTLLYAINTSSLTYLPLAHIQNVEATNSMYIMSNPPQVIHIRYLSCDIDKVLHSVSSHTIRVLIRDRQGDTESFKI